ncbi:hypothetical protein GCM10027344_07070 [Spelaeicoccus albus]
MFDGSADIAGERIGAEQSAWSYRQSGLFKKFSDDGIFGCFARLDSPTRECQFIGDGRGHPWGDLSFAG